MDIRCGGVGAQAGSQAAAVGARRRRRRRSAGARRRRQSVIIIQRAKQATRIRRRNWYISHIHRLPSQPSPFTVPTFTLHPSPFNRPNLHPSPFNRPNLQPSTFNVQHHNVQRYNLQRFSTFNRYDHRLRRGFVRTEPARLVVCQRIATIEGARMNPYAPRTIIKSALHPHR